MIENLTMHMMVKNEERYIRQTLMSTLPYVERAIIVDTGSTDKTIEIIESLISPYSSAFPAPEVTLLKRQIKKDSRVWDGTHLNQDLTNLRNEMLSRTETDWVWQVDGDEIYPSYSVANMAKLVPLLGFGPNVPVGIQHRIKWCVSDTEYINPGPFPTTLRVFPSTGLWQGEFPNEFLFVDNQPMTMTDPRCVVGHGVEFLHMSMVLHPERRPPSGQIVSLNQEEIRCLNI